MGDQYLLQNRRGACLTLTFSRNAGVVSPIYFTFYWLTNETAYNTRLFLILESNFILFVVSYLFHK